MPTMMSRSRSSTRLRRSGKVSGESLVIHSREAKLDRTKEMLDLQRSADDLAILQAGKQVGDSLSDLKEPL